MLTLPQLENSVTDLKSHTGPNEKGWKIKKDINSPAEETTQNGPHTINFGDPSLLWGGYHWHPSIGMFSPRDIATLIEIARYQPVGGQGFTASDGFMGLIAANGVHYIMYFNGTQSQLPAYPLDAEDINKWNSQQLAKSINFSQNNSNYQSTFGILNEKGREALFFDTLRRMSLSKDTFSLHQIDAEGNVSIIKENVDFSTTAVPCQ